GSQHVGVYIDGVRVTNARNGTVDLGKYSLSTLESVSLFNANKTELLMMASEYASASTVYLYTHRPDSSSFTAAYGAGSFNTHRVAATWSFKRLGFIDAQYTHSDGNYPFRYHTQYEDTTGIRRNGDIDQFRVEAAAFTGPLQMHTYYYMSQRGLPGGVVRRLTDKYSDVGREWDRNFFTQLSYRQRFGDFGLRAIVKYANDHLHYRSDYPWNISVHANTRYHQQDAYSAVAASWAWRNVSLSASTDLRWSDLMSDMKQFHYVYRMDSKSSLSAFWRVQNLSMNATMLFTHVADHRKGASKPLNRVTWDALASYSLGSWMLRAFYKSVFRAPTLNDLYYVLVGNRNLRPEYTRQLDLGASYTASWLSLQADAYYNTITDRIVCLPGRGALQWT
ncbi:MAG: TonB-dependent receptor, partial [Prevotellaceae bacterium]|nr:TonB-dependent receptor [Prevotellaceae bacterium]